MRAVEAWLLITGKIDSDEVEVMREGTACLLFNRWIDSGKVKVMRSDSAWVWLSGRMQ